jgi:uncharacterized protein (TIGR02594 family)
MKKHLQIGLEDYLTKEYAGGDHNPRVVQYFKTVGHSWVQDDETAWCAAFVGFCLEKAGLGSTRKLNARSYLDYGNAVTKPQLGDVVVFWRNSPTSWQGHVGFYINEDEDGIRVLGGNQSNQVSIIEYPKQRLLGYRRPPYKEQKKSLLEFTTSQLFIELIKRLRG